MDERISRIKEMEGHLGRIIEWLVHPSDVSVREDVSILEEYYLSPLWRSDFEADEAGMLPSDLKRGVLSEDAVYNALTEYEEQKNRMSESGVAANGMKGCE